MAGKPFKRRRSQATSTDDLVSVPRVCDRGTDMDIPLDPSSFTTQVLGEKDRRPRACILVDMCVGTSDSPPTQPSGGVEDETDEEVICDDDDSDTQVPPPSGAGRLLGIKPLGLIQRRRSRTLSVFCGLRMVLVRYRECLLDRQAGPGFLDSG